MRGSYAGARSASRSSMPSSTRRYASTSTANGAIDLRRSPAGRHRQRGEFPQGARAGSPAAKCCSGEGRGRRLALPLADGSVDPEARAGRPARRGAWSSRACPKGCARSWSSSRHRQASDYRIGLHKFWVLTRYNPQRLSRDACLRSGPSPSGRPERASTDALTWAGKADGSHGRGRPCGSGNAAFGRSDSVLPSSATLLPARHRLHFLDQDVAVVRVDGDGSRCRA
jgi:hypothetical protein